MVEGLDEVAERAGKKEDRESAKKKKAGKDIVMNEALRVDETGKRWSLAVHTGLIVALVVIALTGSLMFWWTNRKPMAPIQAAQETKERLNRYQSVSARMKPFTPDARVSPQQFKEALVVQIQKDLEQLNKTKEREIRNRAGAAPETRLAIRWAEEDQSFKDGWGKELQIKPEGDNAFIISSPNSDGTSPAPAVNITIPRNEKPPEPEKTASNQ